MQLEPYQPSPSTNYTFKIKAKLQTLLFYLCVFPPSHTFPFCLYLTLTALLSSVPLPPSCQGWRPLAHWHHSLVFYPVYPRQRLREYKAIFGTQLQEGTYKKVTLYFGTNAFFLTEILSFSIRLGHFPPFYVPRGVMINTSISKTAWSN